MFAGDLGRQSGQHRAHGFAGQEIGLGRVVAVAGQPGRHCGPVFVGDGRCQQAGQTERQGQGCTCTGRDQPLTAQQQKGKGQQTMGFEDDGHGPQDSGQDSVSAGPAAAGPQRAEEHSQGQKINLSPFQREQQRPAHGEPQADQGQAAAAPGDAGQARAQEQSSGRENQQQRGPQQLGRREGKQGQPQKWQQRRRRVEKTGEGGETQSVPDRGLLARLIHIGRQSGQRGLARSVVGREIHLQVVAGESQPQDRQAQQGRGQGQQQKCAQHQG